MVEYLWNKNSYPNTICTKSNKSKVSELTHDDKDVVAEATTDLGTGNNQGIVERIAPNLPYNVTLPRRSENNLVWDSMDLLLPTNISNNVKKGEDELEECNVLDVNFSGSWDLPEG